MESPRTWVTCPCCEAGSPAGILVCPRCRYRFRLRPALRDAAFVPVAPRETPNPKPRDRARLTIGGVLLVMPSLAILARWPGLLVPVLIFGAIGAGGWLLQGRLGVSSAPGLALFWILYGVAAGLALGSVSRPISAHGRPAATGTRAGASSGGDRP